MQNDKLTVNVLGRLTSISGKKHQKQEVYSTFGGSVMCTIEATHCKEPPKILIHSKVGYKKNENRQHSSKTR